MESTLDTPAQKKWSRFSIIAFVLSILQLPVYILLFILFGFYDLKVLSEIAIFSFPLFAIGILVLNIIGIRKAKKEAKKGKGFSIAGIIISGLSLLFILYFLYAILAFKN